MFFPVCHYGDASDSIKMSLFHILSHVSPYVGLFFYAGACVVPRDEIEDIKYNEDRGKPLRELEDMHGMRCCLHCINCVLKKESTLNPDGRWYCFHAKQWRMATNLFEYCCSGFKQKECSNCGNRNLCGWYAVNRKINKHRFCKRGYINRGLREPSRFAVGRRMPYKGSDPEVIRLEAEYAREHALMEQEGEDERDSYYSY